MINRLFPKIVSWLVLPLFYLAIIPWWIITPSYQENVSCFSRKVIMLRFGDIFPGLSHGREFLWILWVKALVSHGFLGFPMTSVNFYGPLGGILGHRPWVSPRQAAPATLESEGDVSPPESEERRVFGMWWYGCLPKIFISWVVNFIKMLDLLISYILIWVWTHIELITVMFQYIMGITKWLLILWY